MEGPIDRRDFFRSSFIRTAAGLAALNELLGPGMISGSVRFVSAAERNPGGAFCEIEPASVPCRIPFCSWTITYTSGPEGLPLKRALAVRCAHAIQPEHHLTVASSFPAFNPVVTVKNNIGIPRVIWIEPGWTPLPPGKQITITLENYPNPLSTASCAFWILEVDPEGEEPEIGSGLTFLEVPAAGGAVIPDTTQRFNVVLPTRAAVGEPIAIRLSALDGAMFATPSYTGTVYLSTETAFQDLPVCIDLTAADKGSKIIQATPLETGTIRISAFDGMLSAESNPCICTAEPALEHIYWGDYHKHSFHCDGYLSPEENYEYAEKYAFLDWGLISSHDMAPFPKRGAHGWSTLHGSAEKAHKPEVFVTFQGYEWSFNHPFTPDHAGGHKVVIFLNPGDLLPLIPYCYEEKNPEYMPPTALLAALMKRCGQDVIVIPHHLPLFKWWVFPPVEASQMGGPLPGLSRRTVDMVQPVAEVFSRNCGNYESDELKDWIRPVETFGFDLLHTFWLDALKEGVRAGALCGSDNHKFPLGHPSHTSLTAVMAPDLTREGLFRAIQKRRTYGTSGPRVFIAFSIGESKMGDIRKVEFYEPPPLLDVSVESPLPIDFIEIVKVTQGHSEVPHIEPINGKRDATFAWMDPDHDPSRWVCYYLRIHLDEDAHGAWTSPIWLEPFIQQSDEDGNPE